MNFLLAQSPTPPIVPDLSQPLDWRHGALALAVVLAPILYHLAVARKWRVAAVGMGILQRSADKAMHGEQWAQIAVDELASHPDEVRQVVEAAIPDRLLIPAKDSGGASS